MTEQATQLIETKKATASAMLMLDVPAKFILEIASGLRDPDDIAADYGYSPKQWRALEKYDPFIKLVNEKKTELKMSGYSFRMKAQVLAEDLLDDLALHAKKEDVSFHTILETAKFAARAAGIDAPLRENDGKTGNQFSISINLGAGNTVKVDINQQNSGQKGVENDESCAENALSELIPYNSEQLFAMSSNG